MLLNRAALGRKVPSLTSLSLIALSFLIGTLGRADDAQVVSWIDLPKPLTISSIGHDPTLKAASGHELEVYALAPPPDVKETRRFLIEGGLHGNEEQASQFVLWLAHRIGRGESPLNVFLAQGIGFDLLPFANPDGSRDDTRYNGHGVNLNRNFGVLWGVTKENPGAASFSEPETRAIRALFKARQYTAAVDVHGYINWIVSPSEPGAVGAKGVLVPAGRTSAYRQWVSALRQEMPLLAEYQLKNGAMLGDGGAFEDWAFWHQGVFAFCLEMETVQRYVHSYRHDFSNLSKDESVVTIDLFKRYEEFLARMFTHALKIQSTSDTAIAGRH